jgi:hypothetical protein
MIFSPGQRPAVRNGFGTKPFSYGCEKNQFEKK